MTGFSSGVVVVTAVASAAVAFAAAMAWAMRARRRPEDDEAVAARLADKDAACQALLQEKDRACGRMLADKDAACRQMLADKDAATAKFMQTMRLEFANLAATKLKESSDGLSNVNRERLGELLKPLQAEIDRFRQAFDLNRQQQVSNKASFDQAIKDLGERALKIGADAENLAKALKSESKTQGDWGEMVLANILDAAGLKDGVDYIQQAQEADAEGNRLIPDVEIPLPNQEKLLVDSKASVTAYLKYVAADDEATKAQAVKEHLASVRQHMNELADKNYVKKVKGSQGYILMFIPNEGSYLLAMEHDRALATDAFRRHVIIVNPTTLLLCLQIVMLLRAREAQNANAEKISAAAAKMYEKFAGFSETFVDLGKRLDALAGAYQKARGQLCDGKGNVVRQLEGLKEMGVVVTKPINEKLVDESETAVIESAGEAGDERSEVE